MSTYSPTVPMNQDSENGFTMNGTIQEVIRQNFKMLILTTPGERVMKPEFGVGIKRYLFEQFDASVYSRMESRIKSQTATYLPAIRINDISFDSTAADRNRLGITIKYTIRNMGVSDQVEI